MAMGVATGAKWENDIVLVARPLVMLRSAVTYPNISASGVLALTMRAPLRAVSMPSTMARRRFRSAMTSPMFSSGVTTSSDIIIWGDEKKAPSRMPVTDDPGVKPTFTDAEGYVYTYTVIVYPLRLPQPGIVTGVDENVTSVKTLVNTQYVDLQGRTSDTPFQGLNIVRKTYSDGSVITLKAMKNS